MSEHVRYRIYTEDRRGLSTLVARYFDGATILQGLGLWCGETEGSAVIEILGTRADLQNIVHLAGDIRFTNEQSSVIVTWEPISRLDITEQALNIGAL